MTKVLVLGASGHAKVVIDILQSMKKFEIIGCLGMPEEVGKEILGVKVIGTDEKLSEFPSSSGIQLAMGIGGYDSNEYRKKKYFECKEAGYSFVTGVHPSAVLCQGVELGEGTIVCAGVVLNTDVKVGENSIMVTSCVVDHETKIGAHSLIATGCKVGAQSTIASGALVACGASVISRVTVGENALVAAGATVVGDVASGKAVFGTPAKERSI